MSTFIQLIDLHTRHPAELERVLNAWRAHSLRREHIAAVEVRRDEQDSGHLVLQVEYDPSEALDEHGAGGSGVGSDASDAASEPGAAEAVTVVGLLDRPPTFRAC